MHPGNTRHNPAVEKLRELASWYRELAERAGSAMVSKARLRMAEDLELEADRLASRRNGDADFVETGSGGDHSDPVRTENARQDPAP